MSEIIFDKKEEILSPSEVEEILERKKMQLILKRVFDIIFSLLGLTVLLPIFLVISIVIKVDSKGPVFFRQVRVGKNGKEFRILKFRTMVVDADKKGMQITVGKDSRITKSGYVLRKFKLDELPQLINVLFGDMSFVGPRPEVPKYVALYDENQKSVLKVKPGITDIASIEYRDENTLLGESDNPEKTYIEEVMPTKLKLNMEYIRNISIVNDVKLIFKTIFRIIT
ncbi:Sugar transferase involved in LPS biosynthesis (colanic, teichoic acid) [Anaerobranca californiensis DSM 14826]|uniref:Sugar transferase involved in LPS biosynthesis (Colanic, teichoic acid) n=2 Tax=Anaerobranca TaxID=42447 RepID=A0A1M6RJT3_9FIRM|nr:Sugar transferase involved in LPS biosynthesis (colanic, teichoic acid) [Anaerobranca californiensis DSM 14826]